MLPAILHEKIERAAAYAKAARAGATRRAYDSDWAIFTAWCLQHGLASLPATPDVVAVFASDQASAGLNPSTINRRVAAIGHHHRAGGYPAPTAMPTAGRLAEVLAGIRAEHGAAKRQKHPADAAALRNMLAAIDGDGLRALRDRAILAIGMAAALRRSEIVALQVEHVGIVPEGAQADDCPFEDRSDPARHCHRHSRRLAYSAQGAASGLDGRGRACRRTAFPTPVAA